MSTVHDVRAMLDVLDEIIEGADETDLEEALDVRDALLGVIGTAKVAVSMLEQEAYKRLEQPKVINGKRWKRSTVYTNRADHDRIGSMVVDAAAIDLDTGEFRSARDAARRAVHLMQRIYTSDSTSAKAGQLRQLLGVSDAKDEGLVREVATGSKIEYVAIRGGGDAEPD